MEEIIKRKKECSDCSQLFEDSINKMMGRWTERPSEFKKRKYGTCKKCKEKDKERLENHIKERKFCFYLGWSHESIKEYFIKNKPYKGQKLIIADTTGINDSVKFKIVSVVDPDFGKYNKIRITGATDWCGGDLF